MRETGFLDRTVKVGSQSYRYQVFVPLNWTPKKKWPVLVFLHGSGERGNDGLMPTQCGIGPALRLFRKRFPCLVVLPQSPKYVHFWNHDRAEAMALKCLEQTLAEFRGDPRRVCLTGISMGGYGTWRMGAKYAKRFSCLVPICGGLYPPASWPLPASYPFEDRTRDLYLETARKIGKTPVWTFHGGADPVVPFSETKKMVAALKKTHGKVRFTVYPKVDHNSWDRAYAEPRLMPWILSHKL